MSKKIIAIPVIFIALVAFVSVVYLLFPFSKHQGTILIEENNLIEQTNLIERTDSIEETQATEEVTEEVPSNSTEVVPDEVDVPTYHIDLRFDPQTRLLSGTSHITVWNRAELPTDQAKIQVFMNAFQAELDPPVLDAFKERAYPTGIKHTHMKFHRVEVNKAHTNYNVDGTVLTLDLQDAWLPDQKLEISLKWETVIPEIHHRVGTDNGAFWFGNVIPIMAVYDDEWHAYPYETIGDPFFSEASDYYVTIQAPKEYQVITSGNERETQYIEDSRITKVQGTHVRDFAFALSPNHKVLTSETQSGKKVQLYYRYAAEETVQHNLALATKMLDYLEERVGPYPYDQLHIFENKMFITGMEYPGLVFVSAHRLNTATGHVTVLHEIAHQWFYNMIGNNQVLEPWLDESFATYFTDEFLEGDQLEQYYESQRRRLEDRSPDLQLQAVHHYSDWSNYWRSNYRKGSFMIFDLRKRMGEEQFQAFLKEYYTLYQFEIATTEGFKRVVQRYTEEDMDSFFEEWGL
jgi:hypothetical protein